MSCQVTRVVLTWGESLEIQASALDSNEDPVPILDTWEAAVRITHKTLGNKPFMDVELTIANDIAFASIDTGTREWSPGIYVYDIRLTNSVGEDFWSEPIELKLNQRNTLPSTS